VLGLTAKRIKDQVRIGVQVRSLSTAYPAAASTARVESASCACTSSPSSRTQQSSIASTVLTRPLRATLSFSYSPLGPAPCRHHESCARGFRRRPLGAIALSTCAAGDRQRGVSRHRAVRTGATRLVAAAGSCALAAAGPALSCKGTCPARPARTHLLALQAQVRMLCTFRAAARFIAAVHCMHLKHYSATRMLFVGIAELQVLLTFPLVAGLSPLSRPYRSPVASRAHSQVDRTEQQQHDEFNGVGERSRARVRSSAAATGAAAHRVHQSWDEGYAHEHAAQPTLKPATAFDRACSATVLSTVTPFEEPVPEIESPDFAQSNAWGSSGAQQASAPYNQTGDAVLRSPTRQHARPAPASGADMLQSLFGSTDVRPAATAHSGSAAPGLGGSRHGSEQRAHACGSIGGVGRSVRNGQNLELAHPQRAGQQQGSAQVAAGSDAPSRSHPAPQASPLAAHLQRMCMGEDMSDAP
jgi:hypothetical protein